MDKILQTIKNFKNYDTAAIEAKYLNGDCYVFARALTNKFGGEIYYLPIYNHFISKIKNQFYDIRGLVPEEELDECYKWDTYHLFDSLDANRVKFYCIDGKENLSL